MIKRSGDRAAGVSGQDLRLAYHRTAVVDAASVRLRAGEVTATSWRSMCPVLVTEGSDASRNLDRRRDDLQMIAAAVGRTDRAEQLLSDLDGALVSQVAIELGLANAWTGAVDEVWGLGTTDVEGLTGLADSDLHFFYNASGKEDVFAGGLAGNPIWESLRFVEQQQVHRLPDGIWTFGGPLSCQQYADAIVAAYAG